MKLLTSDWVNESLSLYHPSTLQPFPPGAVEQATGCTVHWERGMGWEVKAVTWARQEGGAGIGRGEKWGRWVKEERKIRKKGVGENCRARWGEAGGRDAQGAVEGICQVDGVPLPARH